MLTDHYTFRSPHIWKGPGILSVAREKPRGITKAFFLGTLLCDMDMQHMIGRMHTFKYLLARACQLAIYLYRPDMM